MYKAEATPSELMVVAFKATTHPSGLRRKTSSPRSLPGIQHEELGSLSSGPRAPSVWAVMNRGVRCAFFYGAPGPFSLGSEDPRSSRAVPALAPPGLGAPRMKEGGRITRAVVASTMLSLHGDGVPAYQTERQMSHEGGSLAGKSRGIIQCLRSRTGLRPTLPVPV